MEKGSMKKRVVITSKVVSIFLVLVAVQAHENSLLSESDFIHDSEDPKLPLYIQQFPFKPRFDSETTSVSLESEFPHVSEDNNERLETNQPPILAPWETPPPPKSPYPPESPQNPCKAKCPNECMRHKVPILYNLCSKICKQECMLLHVQVIINCSSHCAGSMPKKFKSDKRKVEGYSDYCFDKCVDEF